MAKGKVDAPDAIAAPLFSAGSAAAARIADITLDPGGAALALSDTVSYAGVDASYGTLLSVGVLGGMAAYHGVSPSDFDEVGRGVVLAAVVALVLVALLPQAASVVTGSLAAGVGYFLLQLAAYYFVAYTQ